LIISHDNLENINWFVNRAIQGNNKTNRCLKFEERKGQVKSHKYFHIFWSDMLY